MTAEMALRYCPSCDNRGLIQVAYRSGESSDVAICDCHAGRIWQARGEAAIRERFKLQPDQQVAWLEDFEAETATPAASDAFVAAGQTPKKRAKL
jgi:hypothetical protein